MLPLIISPESTGYANEQNCRGNESQTALRLRSANNLCYIFSKKEDQSTAKQPYDKKQTKGQPEDAIVLSLIFVHHYRNCNRQTCCRYDAQQRIHIIGRVKIPHALRSKQSYKRNFMANTNQFDSKS
jgi:hypothetical protein